MIKSDHLWVCTKSTYSYIPGQNTKILTGLIWNVNNNFHNVEKME